VGLLGRAVRLRLNWLYLARDPKPAARILDPKPAGPEGERRYTCPSDEISRGDVQLTAPGFQPFSV
jgi:hypothetical protein